MNLRKKLRRLLLSPLVDAVAESLHCDPETWTAFRGSHARPVTWVTLDHNSGRFGVIAWSPRSAEIVNYAGQPMAELNAFERFFLARAAHSALNYHRGTQLNSILQPN